MAATDSRPSSCAADSPWLWSISRAAVTPGAAWSRRPLKPTPDEQLWFNQFRIGLWPQYFEGVQFDRSPETLNQFFRSMTPNTGPFDMNVVSDGVSAVFDRIGPGILFTHSQGGGPGWLTAIKNGKVMAIVAFEPGSGFVFPQGEVPAPIPSAFDTVQGEATPLPQFMALTRIPILILYGDNIPKQADRPACAGQLAGPPANGSAVARHRQPPWRRRDGGAFAGRSASRATLTFPCRT